MARILAISSYVASGHVGLAAIVPALQALGHEVIAVPTVVLSCHYGHAHVGGVPVEAAGVRSILLALKDNDTLAGLDAVITGFLPNAEMVDVIANMLDGLAEDAPDVLYLCDPVMGDDPGGLYLSEAAAAAIRDRLVPLADILTPNRFELSWLTGEKVGGEEDADRAADGIGTDLVAITSVPAPDDQIANVMSGIDEALSFATPRRTSVPHGTGDLFAALLLGHILNGATQPEATARAAAGIALIIEQSIGQAELAIVPNIAAVVSAAPLTGRPLA